MPLVVLVLLVISTAKRLDSGDQAATNSVDDSVERIGWDPGWVEENPKNPKEVSKENLESWPEWKKNRRGASGHGGFQE